MSFTITEAFVKQFGDNIYHLSQQAGSVLEGAVTIEPNIKGKMKAFERLDAVTVQDVTTRHGDTPLNSSAHTRRWLTLLDSEWAELIDDLDTVRMLIDPTNDYVVAAAAAMGRKKDSRIITAFDATVTTGEEFDGTAAFDTTGYTVTTGYVDSGTSSASNLTLAKVRQAKKILDLSNTPKSDRHFVCGPDQIQALLRDTTLTSFDYNMIKPLVEGEVDRLLGFQFHTTTLLPITTTTNFRSCFAWHKRAMKLGIGVDVKKRISERADKRYSTQVYFCMSIGAVRMSETEVVKILCDEDF